MEWTREQKRIIDIRDSNILVSAAAGSGKTAVLVERILNLVKNENKDIDEFLVVTFTKAAAAGMKQKIQKALVEASNNGENVRHIRKQLSLLNKAHITTIDSFCMDVVKSNFHVLGMDPSFRVGDNSELNIVFQESLNEVLENAYAEETDKFKELVEAFSENRGDTGLCDIISRLYKFSSTFPDPFKWLKESISMTGMTIEEFEESVWHRELVNYSKVQLEGAQDLLELGLEICNEVDGPHGYEENLQGDLIGIEELLEACEKGLREFISQLQNFNVSRLKSIRKADVLNEEKQETVKELRGDHKDIVDTLKSLFPYENLDKYIEDLNHMHGPMEALGEVIIELDRVYKENKLSKSIVDFNDLEHYALQILRQEGENGPSHIGNSYRDKLSYIFIDEYQDSNGLQEAIMDQIKRNNNLFMVGDIKQSIYRFRLADPSIFNHKYKLFEKDSEDLKDDVIDRVIELNKNFRSRRQVLEATNFIFSRIMTEELGEIDYNENVFLHQGNEEFVEDKGVELNLIDRNSQMGDDSTGQVNEGLETMEVAELEAIFAADKIKELLNENTIDTNSKDKLRKIDYKDIVILSRAVSNIPTIYEETFRREGIPFYFEGGTGYFDTIEIQVMINLLKIIDNIRQDIPLLSVMRSPIGNFTTKELLKIRLKYPKESYLEACQKYVEEIEEDASEEEFSRELIKKLEEFFVRISDWINRSRYTPLNDLIWEILLETNYYYFVGGLTNGKVRQGNLRLLADKAHEFEKTSMKGLFKFLVYIEKITSSEGDKSSTAKTLGENDNVVRLMTIHKSKGLEFPVVILSGLSKKFNALDMRPKALMHKDYGIAPKYIDTKKRIEKDTIGRIAISKKIQVENLSEEMRILYVAMTRAVDRLIMVGSIKKMDSSFKKWTRGYSQYFLYKGNSYMDWIGSCLFKDRDSEEIEEVLQEGKCGQWNVNRISMEDLYTYIKPQINTKIIDKMEAFLEDIDPDQYGEIDWRLGYEYGYKNSIDVPAKLSVTAINNISSERFKKIGYKSPEMSKVLEFTGAGKNLILDREEFKGSEIGTLIHLIMEHMDIGKPLDKEGIISQLKEFLSKGLITDEEIRFITKNYLDKIQGFYESHIGLRMLKSNRVKKEVPFVIKRRADRILNNLNEKDFILVQGIIDCYFEEDGEIVIIDYKTDKVRNGNTEEIKVEYEDQIILYKEALEKISKKKVKESYLYLFSSGDLVLME